MPRPGTSTIYVPDADKAFYEEFAKELSKYLNVDLKVAQALKMAVIQYQARNKLTGQRVR